MVAVQGAPGRVASTSEDVHCEFAPFVGTDIACPRMNGPKMGFVMLPAAIGLLFTTSISVVVTPAGRSELLVSCTTSVAPVPKVPSAAVPRGVPFTLDPEGRFNACANA